MESIKKDNFTILKEEKGTSTDFANFLNSTINDYSDENIVVDLQNFNEIRADELLKFLSPSVAHYNNNKSFILVSRIVSIDDMPEELRIFPTLQEAEDMVQMEEIERDLGF